MKLTNSSALIAATILIAVFASAAPIAIDHDHAPDSLVTRADPIDCEIVSSPLSPVLSPVFYLLALPMLI